MTYVVFRALDTKEVLLPFDCFVKLNPFALEIRLISTIF